MVTKLSVNDQYPSEKVFFLIFPICDVSRLLLPSPSLLPVYLATPTKDFFAIHIQPVSNTSPFV